MTMLASQIAAAAQVHLQYINALSQEWVFTDFYQSIGKIIR